MNPKITRIQQLLELRKQYGSISPLNASETFGEILQAAITLQSAVEKLDCDVALKHQARKNLIVNVVSGLENFFRDLVIQYEGHWSHEGLNSLLKEKITLGEAYDLFKDTAISKEILVAKSSSFQNIESINYVYTTLTGVKDFYSTLEHFAEIVERAKSCKDFFLITIKATPGWRVDLHKLFQLRHKIVHEPNELLQLDERKLQA